MTDMSKACITQKRGIYLFMSIKYAPLSRAIVYRDITGNKLRLDRNVRFNPSFASLLENSFIL